MKSQSKQSVVEIARLPKSHHNKAGKCIEKNFSAKEKKISTDLHSKSYHCKCSWIYQFTQHLLHFITKNLIPLKLTLKK